MKLQQELKGHAGSVIALDYSKKGYLGEHMLASGSADNTCRIWDLRSAETVKSIKDIHEPVTSVKFSKKSDSSLFYLSAGTKVHTYDLRNEGPLCIEPSKTYDFSGDEINHIDLSENNRFLATGDDEGCVNIIDLSTDKIYKKTSKKHSAICMSVKFRPKKSWDVWSGGMDSKVYEWDFSRGSVNTIYDMTPRVPSAVQMFNPPFVYAIAISEDGKWIAASLGDSTVQLISPGNKKNRTSTEIRLENGHNMLVNCLSFMQPTQLLSGSANGKLVIWDRFDEKTGTSLGPAHQFELEGPIDKLDCLETCHYRGQAWVAAAGVGTQPEQGALCLYTI